MPFTLTTLQNEVLLCLNEHTNSPAGELGDGHGATLQSTLTTITAYLNDGLADLTRTCFPVAGTATGTVVTGQATVALAALTASGATSLWAVRGVSFGGSALTRCTRSMLEIYYPLWMTDATGTPQYWFDDVSEIGLYPRPSAGGTLTASGLVVPSYLVAGTDGLPWLADDLCRLLVYSACEMIAKKNAEDPSLFARAAIWGQEYQDGKTELLQKLQRNDPALAAAHFPSAPLSTPAPLKMG